MSARRQEKLEALSEEIRNSGGRCEIAVVDVSNRAAMEALGQQLAEKGGIDILIQQCGHHADQSDSVGSRG